MQRDGSAKRSLLVILGTAAVLAIVVFAVKHVVATRKAETETKMRENDANFIKKIKEDLPKGGALVAYQRAGEGYQVKTNVAIGGDATLEIDWPVPQADFARIGEGMGRDQVADVLQLLALHYKPDSPKSRFTLVCRTGTRSVTLVFGGDPEVKLISKRSGGDG